MEHYFYPKGRFCAAKKTGIPLTRSGVERKIGRTIIKAVAKLFGKIDDLTGYLS